MPEKKLTPGKLVQTDRIDSVTREPLVGRITQIIETTKGAWFEVNMGSTKAPLLKKFRAGSLTRL